MLALGTKKYILKAKYRLEEIVDMVKEVVGESPVPKSQDRIANN